MESPVSNGDHPPTAPKAPPLASRQLTGEITVNNRPITSRWRPGGSLKPQQPRRRRGRQSGQGEQPGKASPAGPESPAGTPSAAGAASPSGSASPGSTSPAGRAAAATRSAARRVTRVLPGRTTRGSSGQQRPRPGGPARDRARGPRRPLPGLAAQTVAGRAVRLRFAAEVAARKAAGAWRRHPLEAISVALMVVAGLAYPFPVWWAGFLVWLAGAACTTFSRLWDLWDKWVAIAGPVVVVVVGTVLVLALGGMRPNVAGYVHEVAAGGLYLIKISSLLGAGYLAWRVLRGRRSPAVPPWARDRRS
jgi:hypothetical protein